MGHRILAALLLFSLSVASAGAQTAGVKLTPIHAGDELAVTVRGEPTLTQHVTVLPDGTVTYPLVGRIALAGRTPPQAADELSRALRTYLKSPIVTLEVAHAAATRVLVLGNVKNPGTYDVAGTAHVSDAVAAAGGVAFSDGALPPARASRADGSVRRIDLQRALAGDAAADATLDDNAVVYIEGNQTFQVTVLGAVSRPGTVIVHPGDKLSAALARAGTDWANYPDLFKIKLTRTTPDDKTTVYTVEFADALGGDSRYDPALYKGDVVYVPRAKRPLPQGLGIFGFLNRVSNVTVGQ